MELKKGYKQTEVGIIPKDWEVKKIADFNPFITSGSRGWAMFYSDMGDPFLRITNMFRSSIQVNLSDLKFVNLPDNENEGKRTQLQTGDILISITADIGIVSYVDDFIPKPAYINQHVALVRFNNEYINSQFICYFLASANAQKNFVNSTDGGAKAGMSLAGISKINVVKLPTLAEQTSIATALSDADAFISRLETLIAKKRAIKQGAMQQLLKPKEGWVVKKLREIALIKTGKKNNDDKIEEGNYPFFVRSQTIERINSYSFDGEAILIPGEGNIGSVIHYINEKFDYHQRVYKISNFSEDVCGKYIYFCMFKNFNEHAMKNSVKATVDSLRLPTFHEFEVYIPENKGEQTRIAQILSDMDAEIAGLEQKLLKYKRLKQGMMQELLTGKTRLV